MAANKRKQDEKHLKMLREMVALPHNKQCFDCQQRGPTYVNMTIGSFVCTSCSGILRGLNPPSRVKSISMTSFSPEEMEFLKSRGNDYCRKVWLGLFDSRTQTEPESKDEQKVKDFMIQKYEKKRWYVAPDQAFHDQPPTPNSVPSDSLAHATVKPLSSHNQNQHTQSLNRPRVGSGAVTTPPQSQAPPQHPAQPAPLHDIFGDLAGDPFASQQATKAPQQANFADFGNFNALNNASAPQVQASQSGGFLSPSAQSQGLDMFAPSTHSSLPSSIPSTTTPAQSMISAGDKYAALAELDDVFGGSSSTTSLPTSGISTSSGTGIAPSTWNGTTLSTSNSWSGTDSTGSMGWVNVGAAPAAVPASSNPFSMTTNTAVNKINPFMGFSSPPGQQQPAFSQSVQGFGQPQQQQRFQMQQQPGMPASANQQQFGQFPLQQAQPNMFMQSPPSQVGQFGGMQNGVGLSPQAQTWGASAAMVGGWGGFAQSQQGVVQPGGGQFNAFSGAGSGFTGIPVAQPQQFANWGQQPAANPFMGAPGGNKSNPFL